MNRTTEESFNELALALQNLAATLSHALAVRYEAPTNMARLPSEGYVTGVNNPTANVALDDRRMALSDQIRATSSTFREMTSIVMSHTAALEYHIARFEGMAE